MLISRLISMLISRLISMLIGNWWLTCFFRRSNLCISAGDTVLGSDHRHLHSTRCALDGVAVEEATTCAVATRKTWGTVSNKHEDLTNVTRNWDKMCDSSNKLRIWDFTDKNQAIPDGVAIQTEGDVSLPLIRLIDRIGPPCEGFLGFRHDQQMCAGYGSKPFYPIHTKIVVVNVRPPLIHRFCSIQLIHLHPKKNRTIAACKAHALSQNIHV